MNAELADESAAGLRVPALISGRRTDIDAIRGIAIILVVFGHAVGSASPGTLVAQVGKLIYTFHIPLFAFVSGFVLWRAKPYGVSEWLKKRFLGLLLPYLAWFAIAYVVAWGFTARPPMIELPLALVSADLPLALWFLYALFLCCVLLTPFRRSPALLLGSAAVVALLPHGGGVPPWPGQLLRLDPSSIEAVGAGWFAWRDVLWLYPFVALGAATAPVFDELRARRTKLAVAAAAIAAVLLPLTWNPGWLPQAAGQVLGAAGPAVGGYVWVLCRFALALAEIVLTFVVVGFCGERVQRWHAIFGVNTLGVYALHQFFLPWHVLREPWSQLLTFAFALGCSLAFTAGISRYRVASRLLLGKGAASPLFAQGGQSAG